VTKWFLGFYFLLLTCAFNFCCVQFNESVSQSAVIYGRFGISVLYLMCVVVTMFLGLYTAQLALPMWCTIVMIVYICFHAGVELILAVHMHANKCCPPASSEM